MYNIYVNFLFSRGVIMIIDEIKKQNMLAMKEKDSVKRNALSVVINKYMLVNIEKKAKGEEATDTDMVAILQKSCKELLEEAENYLKAGNAQMHEEILTQKKIIESFLPQMMSKEEIKEIILSLPDTTIPTVMKHFKANYAGKVDMRDVQDVLKSL